MKRRGFRGAAIVASLCLILGVVAACGPDASYYRGLLGKLPIPQEWQLVHEEAMAPGTANDCAFFLANCPSVARYYRTSESVQQAYAMAKRVLIAGGFAIVEEYNSPCPGTSYYQCTAVATYWSDEILLTAGVPGSDDGQVLVAPGQTLVRLVAREKV